MIGLEVIAFAILLFGGFAGLIGGDSPDEDVENTSDDPSEGETETPTQPSLLDPPEEEEIVDDVLPLELGDQGPDESQIPTVFDDDDGAGDDGKVVGGDEVRVLSGGVRAEGANAHLNDVTTPNDVMEGGSEQELFLAGAGNDFADGGSGNDILFGQDGSDFLQGSFGDDSLVGGPGDDILSGFEWMSSESSTREGGTNELLGGSGDDVLGADFVNAGGSNSTGGSGNDLFNTLGGDQRFTDFGDDNGVSGDESTLNNDYMSLWGDYGSLSEAKADLENNGRLTKSDGSQLTVDGLTAHNLTEYNTGLSDDPSVRLA